jgi:hypothetical protein
VKEHENVKQLLKKSNLWMRPEECTQNTQLLPDQDRNKKKDMGNQKVRTMENEQQTLKEQNVFMKTDQRKPEKQLNQETDSTQETFQV